MRASSQIAHAASATSRASKPNSKSRRRRPPPPVFLPLPARRLRAAGLPPDLPPALPVDLRADLPLDLPWALVRADAPPALPAGLRVALLMPSTCSCLHDDSSGDSSHD